MEKHTTPGCIAIVTATGYLMKKNFTPTWKILRKLLVNNNPVTISVYRSIVMHRRIKR